MKIKLLKELIIQVGVHTTEPLTSSEIVSIIVSAQKCVEKEGKSENKS